MEARVEDFFLAAHVACIRDPALAVRRIGQHEVELPRRMAVGGERRAKGDVFRLCAVALEQHVGLGDGVRLGIHFLPEKVDGHFPAVLGGEREKPILCHGEHAACAACAVVA